MKYTSETNRERLQHMHLSPNSELKLENSLLHTQNSRICLINGACSASFSHVKIKPNLNRHPIIGIFKLLFVIIQKIHLDAWQASNVWNEAMN